MTLFIPPLNAEVAYVFQHDLDPDPWSVTFGMSFQAALDPEEGLAELELFWADGLDGLMSDKILLLETRGRFSQGENPEPLEVVVAGGGNRGGAGSAHLPQNCALLVTKNTGIGGRKHKGRFFWPGILGVGGVNEAGIVTPADRTAIQGTFNEWFDKLGKDTTTAAGWTGMSLLHNTQILADEVVSLTVSGTLSTQRRRLR